jgi:hypothetical protein
MLALLLAIPLLVGLMVGVSVVLALRISWLLLRGAVHLLALTVGVVAQRLDPAP